MVRGPAGSRKDRGSIVTTEPCAPREVWLRGNLRVATVLGAVALLLDAVAMACVLVAVLHGGPSAPWWGAAAISGVAAGAAFLLAWAAARPRLEREGTSLVVRVSPLVQETVPLDIVECFFPGSNAIDAEGAPTGGEDAAFRVGTLVIRLAERALDHRERETFRPWVTWDDGSIVLDGRWCEPLTPALARELGARLVAAKRSMRDATPAGGGASGATA